mmetsp:Transcript_28898/g.60701  ORF Transcript_28898/g.60701 Transcript_28898/m.60701 type:complete len:224 (-) Transcript_28898:594-1265(-)
MLSCMLKKRQNPLGVVSTHHSAPCCRPATRPGEQGKCKKAQSRGACHESHMPRTTILVARVLYRGTKSRHNRYKLIIPELPQAIACRLDLAGQKHLNKDRNRGNGPVLEGQRAKCGQSRLKEALHSTPFRTRLILEKAPSVLHQRLLVAHRLKFGVGVRLKLKRPVLRVALVLFRIADSAVLHPRRECEHRVARTERCDKLGVGEVAASGILVRVKLKRRINE